MAKTWVTVLLLSGLWIPAEVGLFRMSEVQAGTPRGHVAMHDAESGRWRMLANGDRLTSGLFRTSSAGPCRLAVLGQGELTLSPDCEVRCDLKHRLIVVRRGRALLDLRRVADRGVGDDTWTITSARVNDVNLQAAAPFAMEYSDARTAVVYHGQVAVHGSDADGQPKTQTLTEPRVLAWGKSKDVKVTQPRQDAWRKDARRWADGAPSIGLGQLVVKDAQSNDHNRMEIARYHVNVVLKPPVALVQIDESFYNPYSRQREGTFVFNLPRGASISRFAMFVTHEKLIEGEVVERKRASKIYESIVRTMRDPAILEQIGDNQFRMRVFPIPAKDTKRILLDFTVPLVPIDGRYEFHLPLMGDKQPVWDFGLSGTAEKIDTASFHSPSFPNLKLKHGKTASDDPRVRFALSGRMLKVDRDLALTFRQPQQPEFHVSSYADVDERGNKAKRYFLAEIPAREISPNGPQPLAPADVLIVADTSGTSPLPLVRKAVRTVLHNLRPDDRFQLGCLDASYRPLFEGTWEDASREHVDAALADLDRQVALGGTSLLSSLSQANDRFDEDGRRPRVLIYIGDGHSTIQGANRPFEVFAGEDTYVVGVWTGPSQQGRQELQNLSDDARAFRLFDATTGPGALGELFSWVLRGMPEPRQVKVHIEGAASIEVFVNESHPDGEIVQVYGSAPVKNELRLTAGVPGEQPRVNRVLTFGREDDVFVGRLWAQRKLNSLLAVSKNVVGLKKSIIDLSEAWSLL